MAATVKTLPHTTNSTKTEVTIMAKESTIKGAVLILQLGRLTNLPKTNMVIELNGE